MDELENLKKEKTQQVKLQCVDAAIRAIGTLTPLQNGNISKIQEENFIDFAKRIYEFVKN